MTTEIIVALITGGLSLLGVVLSNNASNKKMQSKMSAHQEVLDTRLENLTKQVEKHNSVIERTYGAEQRIMVLEEKQKTANHRIADLENELKNYKE